MALLPAFCKNFVVYAVAAAAATSSDSQRARCPDSSSGIGCCTSLPVYKTDNAPCVGQSTPRRRRDSGCTSRGAGRPATRRRMVSPSTARSIDTMAQGTAYQTRAPGEIPCASLPVGCKTQSRGVALDRSMNAVLSNTNMAFCFHGPKKRISASIRRDIPSSIPRILRQSARAGDAAASPAQNAPGSEGRIAFVRSARWTPKPAHVGARAP